MKVPSPSRVKDKAVEAYRTDTNLNRLKSWYEPVKRRLPSATAEYLVEKLPVVQWLPHYDIRWLFQDFLAGITVGVMLIPQGLSYAKIGDIPVEHGLYSSWFPSALYFFLGTSKDLSTGPTSVLGLFTSEAVHALSSEGYSPADIASAVAFMVGVYSLILGTLKLGFLLDFISAPVLSGWISAVAVVIGLGQVGSLVGISNIGDGTANIIHDVLTQLNTIQPLTLAIGFTGIAVLWTLQEVGKRWGKKNKWIKLLATSRAVIVLVVYTLISWGVNHGRDEADYKWSVAGVDTKGLPQPKTHDSALLSKVAGRSVAPLVAMAVEHLGTGKAFALRNGYELDKSQELVFLGANNMVNSLFGAMSTGAAMSRTAVNSESGVRSPLSFVFTAAWIILTLYEFAPALYWIPKATLAAIIIMAVAHLVSTPPVFYRYWRMSFLDFIASQVGLWVTLFTSTEIGLAASVGWSIVYTLLRLAFPRWIGISHLEAEDQYARQIKHVPAHHEVDIPPEIFLVRFNDDALFPNAERIKNSIIESIKIHFEPPVQRVDQATSVDRTWNPASHKKIEKLRRRKGIQPIRDAQLRYVVLDFTKMTWIDVSGVFSIIELQMELRRYIGQELQFRFFGMTPKVRERFERDSWEFAQEGEEAIAGTDVIYDRLENALSVHPANEKTKTVTEKALEV